MKQPLVTILITARNRPDELSHTLRLINTQKYENLELLLIDDASVPSLEPLVREVCPQARYLYNATNKGLIANRTTGMSEAQGAYIVSLDDDSCFTAPDDLARAVARMENEPHIGVLTFMVFHGPTLPECTLPPLQARYVSTFIGCAHMIRKEVVQSIGGYRDFYFYYGEEAELSLRILDAGWYIFFDSSIVVHHRVSQDGRRNSLIAAYSLRNNIWTVLLNMPLRRAIVQVMWRLWSHSSSCLRHGDMRLFLWAFWSMLRGLPTVIRIRQPLKAKTVELVDLLRVYKVTELAEIDTLRKPSFGDVVVSFYRSWKDRPRSSAWWSRTNEDLGRSEFCYFTRQFQGEKKKP